MRRSLYLILLFGLVVFMGCVEKTDSFYQSKSSISDIKVGDSNGDGIPDRWMFEFEPYTNNRGVRFTREILIEGVENNVSFRPKSTHTLDPTYEETLLNAIAKVSNFTFDCSHSLDEVMPCDSEPQCQSKCLSLVRCKTALAKYSNLQGSFYETSNLYFQVLNSSKDFYSYASTHKTLNDEEYDVLKSKAAKLTSDISRLLNTPSYSLMLCNPNDLTALQSLLKNLDNIYISKSDPEDSYFYLAYNQFKITNRLSIGYSNDSVMTLNEVIPSDVATSPSLVSFKSSPSAVSPTAPVNAKFRLEFRKGSIESQDVVYEVNAPYANWSSVLTNYYYPSGDLTYVDFTKIQIIADAQALFYNTYNSLSLSLGNRVYALSIAVFVMLMLLYLVKVLIGAILAIFETVSKRESLVEVVYKVAGISAGNRVELIALALGSAGIGWYFSNGLTIPDGVDVIAHMLKTPYLLLSVGLFNLSLFALYYLISDVIKGLLLSDRYYMSKASESVHKLILEKDLKKELSQMRSDILNLRDMLVENGLVLHEDIDGFISKISKADNLISQGKINNAQSLVDSKIRSEYLRLREHLSMYKNRLNETRQLVNEIHDELDQLESLRSKALKLGLNLGSREWLIEMDKYKEYISKGDYDGAAGYLKSLLNDLHNHRVNLFEQISQKETLLNTKFPCPVCGQLTSLASETCEHCGVPLSEGFNTKLTQVSERWNSYSSKIARFNSPDLTRLHNSINVLIDHLREYINEKKYDKASQLLNTIDDKFTHLDSVISNMEAKESSLEQSLEHLDQMIQSITGSIEEGINAGLDMSPFQNRFESLKSTYDNLQSSNAPLYEISSRVSELEESFNQLERDVKNYTARYMSSLKALDRLNNLFSSVSTLITKAESLGIDASEYNKRLEMINFDGLVESIERNELSGDDLNHYLEELSLMESELTKKIDAAKRSLDMIEKIKQLYAQAESQISICIANRIHPFEESSYLSSLNVDALKEDIKYISPDSLNHNLEKYSAIISKLQDIIAKLNGKLAAIKAWPTWKAHIEALIAKMDAVDPSLLSDVPPEWRSWAMERFVEETKLPVTLKGNQIVKLKDVSTVSKSDLDQLLASIVASAKISGAAIIRRDGLVITSNLPEGVNPQVLGALSANAMRNSQKAFDAFDKGKVNYIAFNAKENKLVVGSAGDQALLTIIVDPNEDLGFISVTLKNAGRRIASLLSKL